MDRWVDESVASRIRGNPVADRMFYAASALGDHGIIWLILAVVRGLRSRDSLRGDAASGRRRRHRVGARQRADQMGVPPRNAPRHAASRPTRFAAPAPAAFRAGTPPRPSARAALLSDGDPTMRPLYFALAVVVAWSRVHVRVHHASDVVGGVAIGLLLGQVFKRLVPLDRPSRRPPGNRRRRQQVDTAYDRLAPHLRHHLGLPLPLRPQRPRACRRRPARRGALGGDFRPLQPRPTARRARAIPRCGTNPTATPACWPPWPASSSATVSPTGS